MRNRKFHFDIVQGTEEWHDLRRGRIGKTTAKTLSVKGKASHGFGVGAVTQMHRIVEERLTGKTRESYSGKATEHGHEFEPIAREHYELYNFIKVTEIGYVEYGGNIGCSPDGVIPKMKKGIEIKCRPTQHMTLVIENKYEENDYFECQYNLWCTEYDSWDLIYYHDSLPDHLKMLVFTFKPDLKLFEEFENLTSKFEREICAIIKRLEK